MNIVKRLSILIGVLGLILVVAAACGGANQDSQQEPSEAGGEGEFVVDDSPLVITMGGASSGGLWQVIGESYSAAVRKVYPGSTVAYEPGNQAGSLVRMINGEVEMAASPSIVELKVALEGGEPFTETYTADDFYILGKVYDHSAAHVIMNKDFADRHGITSLRDIREKEIAIRISMNERGNLTVFEPAKTLLEAHGITIEDIEAWGGEVVYGGSSQIMNEMKDGKLNMFITHGFPPHGSFVDLATSTDLVFLDLEDEAIQEVVDKWGYKPYTIEAGSYNFQEKTFNTYAADAYFLIGPHVPEETAYKLAKVMHEEIDSLRDAYAAFAGLTVEMLLDIGDEFKLHPGVERYFKEQGILE